MQSHKRSIVSAPVNAYRAVRKRQDDDQPMANEIDMTVLSTIFNAFLNGTDQK